MKSLIMKEAWVKAKRAANLQGGTAKEWMAWALVRAWKDAKEGKLVEQPQTTKATRIEKTTNEITAIKDWFVRKNFSQNEAYVIETNDWIEVLEETAKAYKLRVHNADFGNITTWAPKSCCVA